jgi:hypothetical protein
MSLEICDRLEWLRSRLVNSRGIFFSYSHTRFSSLISFFRCCGLAEIMRFVGQGRTGLAGGGIYN